MREILFKAKRKDVGWWQEGQIVQIKDRYFITDEDCTEIEKSMMYITGEINYDLKFMYEVFPETICEYTGLTDKNGVKIFEGDIILIGEKRRKVEVTFKDGQFGYLYNGVCINFQYQKPEIIGNVFDEGVENVNITD